MPRVDDVLDEEDVAPATSTPTSPTATLAARTSDVAKQICAHALDDEALTLGWIARMRSAAKGNAPVITGRTTGALSR